MKLQAAHPDKRLEIWFQDEARVGQQGRLTRIWGQKGKRDRIRKDMRFEYTYIYGAICPERDTGEALVIKQVSKKAMQGHLKMISDVIPSDRHAVLVMDRAPWHRSLQPPENISIIYLPSYSPELNPHENIWEYLKNNYLSNRVFENAQHIVEACCGAWNKLVNEVGRIRSIATRKWTSIN